MRKTLIPLATTNWEWIDLEGPTEDELQEVAAEYGLHRTSVIDSMQPEHLPKYEEIGNVIFMITRVYDTHARLESDTIQELTNKLAIFYSGKFIITIHRHPSDLLQKVMEQYVETGMVNSTADLLARLIKEVFKTYEAPAHKLEESFDYYEAKTFLNDRMPPLTKGLYHLKRKADVSRRVLRLSEVILDNLKQLKLQPTEVQDLRDLYVHLVTLYDEITDSTNNLINIYISLSSQKTNDVMRVLTIFSAFFLPLTFIAGVYGMNFHFMPELNKTYGYPAVVALMGAVTLFIYMWFRKKRWL